MGYMKVPTYIGSMIILKHSSKSPIVISIILIFSLIFSSLPAEPRSLNTAAAENPDITETKSSESSRGMETIWSDTFEGGTFLKWDAIPPSNEISILQSGSVNFGSQSTQAAHTGSQKFVEGWDTNDELNFIEKTFTNLHEYENIKFKFYWAEQDIELDETCDIQIYDKVNGYQTLKTIGSNNGNEDGIVLADWNIEQYDLYDLSGEGLSDITDWTEIRIRFEWVAGLDDLGEVAGDQWFLDDVELLGDRNAQLVNGKVNPQEGTILDKYKYSVVYTDTGNDAPFFVKLNLNGENFSMLEDDFADTNYADGKLFTYETDLVWGVTYNYRFWTSDGLEIVGSELLTGPTVNKGPPHKIIVSSSKSSITTDETLQFSADAFDAHDNPVIFAPDWDVSGGGYINDAGRLTATNLGTWKVYANYTEGPYHASGVFNITITPGELKDLVILSSITSTPPIVTADEVVVFDVIGMDADFNIIPTDDYTITLTVTGGGTLHDNGTYEPRIKGHYSVYANTTVESETISDRYDFQIIQGLGITLEVFPPKAQITAGSDVLFTLKVYDSESNSFTPSFVEWSVTGGGTISELGIFEARTMGDFTVSATYINNNNESITGSLQISIDIGKIKGINLIRNKSVIFVNDHLELKAEAFDEFGNKKLIEPDWDLGGGEYDNSTKTYLARTAGTWTLYANTSGISGSFTLYINDKPLSSIVIEPGNPLMVREVGPLEMTESTKHWLRVYGWYMLIFQGYPRVSRQ
jgi:hypothetical protein